MRGVKGESYAQFQDLRHWCQKKTKVDQEIKIQIEGTIVEADPSPLLLYHGKRDC